MCFYNDYDWMADVYEDHVKSGLPGRCVECGSDIPLEERRRVVDMYECDGCCKECGKCEEDCECEGGPEPGEEWHGQVCRGCSALLAAIRLHERREECPLYAQQPALGELIEAFSRENDNAPHYRAVALKLFPSLASHPFLKATTNDD